MRARRLCSRGRARAAAGMRGGWSPRPSPFVTALEIIAVNAESLPMPLVVSSCSRPQGGGRGGDECVGRGMMLRPFDLQDGGEGAVPVRLGGTLGASRTGRAPRPGTVCRNAKGNIIAKKVLGCGWRTPRPKPFHPDTGVRPEMLLGHLQCGDPNESDFGLFFVR